MPEPDTLPKLLLRNIERFPDRPAMREKDRGIWQTYTWREYWEHVRDFAYGLAANGFGKGDKATVVGDNRPRLYWAELSAQALGGMAVPVYQDSIASELVFVLTHAEVSVVIAEDQEQVDKILSLKDQLPRLRLVVYDDPRGMNHYRYPWLKSFGEVTEAGRELARAKPGLLDDAIAAGGGDDVAMLAYTSGTTGNPKGAMLSHRNLLSIGQAFLKSEVTSVDDEWLAYLPMAWVGDSVYSLVFSLMVGFAISCPESPETVQRDLRELGPTGVLAPPRIWENMLTGVQVRAQDASPLKRWVFGIFRDAAVQAEILRGDGKPVLAGLKLLCALGEFLVYAPIRDQLGMRRARWAYTGGAPLGADTFRFFRAIGVNLKQIYGSTELSALVSLQPDNEADPNTVGRPCAGIEVKTNEQGEVLVRGPGVFQGYYKAQAATSEAIDPDGWFRTGDAGFLDKRGHLVIIDRAKDVGKLTDGTAFAPQFIENKLKFSPFIREAIAFGNDRPFVCAMVAIDLNTVGSWAERRNIAYTSFTDLSGKPEVRLLVAEEIGKCNATLPDSTLVRRFLLLPKDFDADDAEITRTRKLRRRFIAEKYDNVIQAFYADKRECEIRTEVTFEDGRKSMLTFNVAIADVEREAAHV
ncbi:MAG: long-chain fatty acid--CoA ligase [Alphaproteobacteria bacterium]|nr:long-chain fatty acid--CoA ligase [Alphaproteobacteria bacterium]